MIPVHRLMPEALAQILKNAPLSAEKVEFAWRAAVGPSVGRVTTVALRDGILHVRAKDAAWQREVRRSAGLIRVRLDALLGKGIVKAIDVAGQ